MYLLGQVGNTDFHKLKLFYTNAQEKEKKKTKNISSNTNLSSAFMEDFLVEKEMATHSSILAWRIPWMEEPGRLQSMGSQRVGHD